MTVEIDLGIAPNGDAVTGIAVSLNVGSGLNKAVRVQPIEANAGDVVYIAVKARLVKDTYDYQIDDETGESEGVTHVLVLKTMAATFVDQSVVSKSLQASIDRIAEADELAKSGQSSFGLITEDEDEDEDATITDLPNAKAARKQYGDIPDKVDEAMKGGK